MTLDLKRKTIFSSGFKCIISQSSGHFLRVIFPDCSTDVWMTEQKLKSCILCEICVTSALLSSADPSLQSDSSLVFSALSPAVSSAKYTFSMLSLALCYKYTDTHSVNVHILSIGKCIGTPYHYTKKNFTSHSKHTDFNPPLCNYNSFALCTEAQSCWNRKRPSNVPTNLESQHCPKCLGMLKHELFPSLKVREPLKTSSNPDSPVRLPTNNCFSVQGQHALQHSEELHLVR